MSPPRSYDSIPCLRPARNRHGTCRGRARERRRPPTRSVKGDTAAFGAARAVRIAAWRRLLLGSHPHRRAMPAPLRLGARRAGLQRRHRTSSFAPGQFAPDTPAGRELIAHELYHVKQDGAHRPEPGGPLMIDAPDSPQERQAELAARSAVGSGESVSPAMAHRGGRFIQPWRPGRAPDGGGGRRWRSDRRRHRSGYPCGDFRRASGTCSRRVAGHRRRHRRSHCRLLHRRLGLDHPARPYRSREDLPARDLPQFRRPRQNPDRPRRRPGFGYGAHDGQHDQSAGPLFRRQHDGPQPSGHADALPRDRSCLAVPAWRARLHSLEPHSAGGCRLVRLAQRRV